MTERKAKRRLKNFDFRGQGAHLALVHKEQGGAANGYSTLVMKSAANFSEEFIEKMQQVRITLELDDFLETFFHLYEDDAKILAAMMGYKEESEEGVEPSGTYQDDCFYEWYCKKMEAEGRMGEYGEMPEPTTADEQEWIAMRLEGIEVLKALKESDSIAETLSNLTEKEYLSVLRDQERVEKALARKESVLAAKKAKEQPVVADNKPKARIVKKVEDKGHKAEVTEAVEKQAVVADEAKAAVKAESKEVLKMTDKTVQVEKTETVDMVEKSQFDLIQKALDEQKAELQKALDAVEVFKAREKAAIAKARQDALKDVLAEDAKVEVMFKAVGELEQEQFDAVVGLLKGLATEAETNPMFVEKGVSVEGGGVEAPKEDALTALIKARYNK